MILLKDNLEAFVYNENRISIKDLSSDLDIGDSKWNFLFDLILKTTHTFYFFGERLEYSDNNHRQSIEFLSETDIDNIEDHYNVFFKLRPAGLIINRKRLSKLWSYYEYPAIIFLGCHIEEKELRQFFDTKITYEKIVGSIEKVYLIHRNFEPDVLWIEKSWDMPDMQILLGNVSD